MNRPSFTHDDLKSLLQKHSSTSYTHVQIPEPVCAVISRDSDALGDSTTIINQKDLEISRLKEALKRIIEKSQDQSALVEELSRYKKATLELAQKLAAQNPNADEQKKRLLQVLNEKKELEATVSALSFEKATLIARLHELSIKTKYDSQKELLEKRLTEAKESFDALQTAKYALETELQNALQQIENLETTHKQELSVSQACLLERQHAYNQEHEKYETLLQEFEKLKTEAKENKQKLEHVQQQLARRIKECALLEKQAQAEIIKASTLEENLRNETQRCNRLEASLEVLEKNEEQLRQELLMKSTLHEEKVASLQDKLGDLMREIYAQKDELEVMHKQKARLVQLEELYAKFGQIVTTTNVDFSLITKDIPFEYDR